MLLLLCSHSPNDVLPEPQRNVSIAVVRGAVRPSKNWPMQWSVCVIYSKSTLDVKHSKHKYRWQCIGHATQKESLDMSKQNRLRSAYAFTQIQ